MSAKSGSYHDWKKLKKQQRECLLLEALLLPAFLCYLELMFHLFLYKNIEVGCLYAVLQALLVGFFINALAACFSSKVNRRMIRIAMLLFTVWFSAQLVYFDIFRCFLSVNLIRQNTNAVLEFWKQTLDGIKNNLLGILVFVLPLFFLFPLMKRKKLYQKRTFSWTFCQAGCFMILCLIFMGALRLGGKKPYSAYDLYRNDFVADLGVEKLGLITAFGFDVKKALFPEQTFLAVQESVSAETTPIPTKIVTPKEDKKVTATPTISPTPEEILPVVTTPNELPIDFGALIKNEKNQSIANLHAYFKEVEPTNKNAYTGMFEGYNLILLTAEGFCPFAVHKEVTPTLYQLAHSGFVFENFYNPIWWTSTSDGEFVECTGLIPSGTNSMTKSADCKMPLCPGWQFQKLGYTARAYHNHTYTYYHRDKTHPNMGYDYKGIGNGLDVKKTWPESDLEMMEKTVPEFINDPKFHVYYMTVSGHMQYTFLGNSMASKNREYVKDLPYSENCKAYIACQKELDLALAYLIKELDKKGVLDNTVIALSGDHYPYGLTIDEINELAGHTVDQTFELYRNNFILWNAAMKEPVTVTKCCSTLDILPTLYNLFGIDYDSRLFFGQDILSDASPLVMTSNQSFMTDQVRYDSKTGKAVGVNGNTPSKEYVSAMIKKVRNKFNASAAVIKNDYYSHVDELLGFCYK